MIEGRDSKGHFIKSNVPWNKKLDSSLRKITKTSLVVRKVRSGAALRLVPVGPKKLIGGGVVKLDHIRVTCPACGKQVEAVAGDGRVKGYCAVARRYVDFQVKARLVPMGS